MKSLKWIAAGVLLAAAVTAVVSGTFANNNVTSKPQIDQIVMKRTEDGSELTAYQNDILLLPARYDTVETTEKVLEWDGQKNTYKLWADEMENVVDHFVFVKNGYESTGDGSYDGTAYVRTWFAFEQGSLTKDEINSVLILNQNTTDWSWEIVSNGTEIEDNTYLIMCATYTANAGALKPAEISAPSLLQIMLSKDTTSDQAERLDGDKDGKYEVKVYTQSVSAAGIWDTAFGSDHPWTEIETQAEATD